VGLRAPLDPDQQRALEAGIALEEGTATLFHLRRMTEVEVEKLDELLDPSPGGLAWYRATLRQGWKRQLRRMFAAVGMPIERLVRVRIGPVRIDGLKSGRTRSLKAPEVRGLGSGAGRSRDATDTPSGPRSRPGRRPPTNHYPRGVPRPPRPKSF
jgi:16S rRNA U516 pseudouridylate synthase RsuA-like enzyme